MMSNRIKHLYLYFMVAFFPLLATASPLVDELTKLKTICDADLMSEAECKNRRSEIWEKYNNPMNEVSWYCNYDGSEMPKDALNYTEKTSSKYSERASASAAVKEILDAAGLSPNFVVRANGVPNAAAIVRGTTRFIEFNPSFIQQLKSNSGTNWSVYSVLAHEIGHHLQGHTLRNSGSRPNIELEADEYSGFILASMGASQADALAAMKIFGSERGSATHPAKSQRLLSISKGWEKGSDKSGGVTNNSKPSGTCYIDDVIAMIDDGANKKKIIDKCDGDVADATDCNIRKVIRLAQGGRSERRIKRECDTPVVIADVPSTPRTPTSRTSNICQTPAMWCAIGQSANVGTPCWCNTIFGPSNGQIIPTQ